MHEKKPVPNEKTKSEKIDQIPTEKPLPKTVAFQIKSDTTPLPSVDAAEKLQESNLSIENDRPVSLSEVLELKKTGNYEVLEYHIRRGALEMLPTADVERLVRISQEHAFLFDAARRLLAALQPLLDKEAEVSNYLDIESKLKIDFAKIMEEAAMVMMNPERKGGLPFWNLIQSCFDSTQFEGMTLQPLQSIMAHQGFELKPYQDFAEKLGLMPSQMERKELAPESEQG